MSCVVSLPDRLPLTNGLRHLCRSQAAPIEKAVPWLLLCRNLRNNGTKFRQLAGQKPRIVQRLFQTYGFQTIVLADTDTVWLRHPDGECRLCSVQ